MPSSRGSSQPRTQTQVSRITGGFFTISTTRKAQEDWHGCLVPSPGDLPDPGIELESPALQAESLPAELLGKGLDMQYKTSPSVPKILGIHHFSLCVWTYPRSQIIASCIWVADMGNK